MCIRDSCQISKRFHEFLPGRAPKRTIHPSMDYLEKARRVLDVEILELQRLRERLNNNFSKAVDMIKGCVEAKGKVVVLGVGKSGHIGNKIASTLTSTGSPAVVLDSLNACLLY